MTWFQSSRTKYIAVGVGSAVLGVLIAWPLFAAAQDKKDPVAKQAPVADKGGGADKDLAEQIRQLNAKIARLEAALPQDPKGATTGVLGKVDSAPNQDKTGAPAGYRIATKYQNCIQCHQTRPSTPLPYSHLEKTGDKAAPAMAGGMAGMGDKMKPAGGMGMGMMDNMMGMGGKKMGMKDADEMTEMMQMMEMMQMKMKKMMGGMGSDTKSAGGMSMGGDKGGMGMMDGMMGMGGMGGDKGGMGMMDMDMMEMMGMMGMAPKSSGGMAGMKGMGKMQMQAALPGFPGASHIYHVGATDFFLNHPEHITLTSKQASDLGRLKEKAILAKTSAQRKIDEAEQELWNLTSADEPDATKIEAKIREIEKLRGDQRMAFIRAVGDAAKLLTDEQRKILVGEGQSATPAPHVHPKTP